MSILRSGFRYSPGNIVFQDGVKNYKQTAHTRFDGSPFGDFVYVFTKPLENSLEASRAIDRDSSVLSDKIDLITRKAFSLIGTGYPRDQVLTKYFDKLVLVIQDTYVSSSLDTNILYKSISSSQLGKLYSESN
jgi:hypothetical protein